MPEVPTLHEAGVTGYEANTWQMMVGPARHAGADRGKLNQALVDFMLDAGGTEAFHSLGMQPMTGTPAERGDLHPKRDRRWTQGHRGGRHQRRLSEMPMTHGSKP